MLVIIWHSIATNEFWVSHSLLSYYSFSLFSIYIFTTNNLKRLFKAPFFGHLYLTTISATAILLTSQSSVRLLAWLSPSKTVTPSPISCNCCGHLWNSLVHSPIGSLDVVLWYEGTTSHSGRVPLCQGLSPHLKIT